MKYRWTYLDDRGRWYLRAKSYYSFGSSLHRALERFHDSGDNGVETMFELAGALEEGWVEAGYRSQDDMNDAFGEGLQILERHVEQHRQREDDATTLFVEKQLRFDMGEFNLIGRLDRVDEYPDGTVEVVDYKTGRTTVSVEDVANDIAMNIYQLLLSKKYPGRSVRARIVALKSGESATHSFDGFELDAFEMVVHAIGQEILEEQWEAREPVRKSLCTHCDFLPLCSHNPVFT